MKVNLSHQDINYLVCLRPTWEEINRSTGLSTYRLDRVLRGDNSKKNLKSIPQQDLKPASFPSTSVKGEEEKHCGIFFLQDCVTMLL